MRQSSDTIAIAFGSILRERRLACGLSQERLALDAGLDRTFISLMERGLRVPTLGVVLALGAALDTRGSELVAQVEKRLLSHH